MEGKDKENTASSAIIKTNFQGRQNIRAAKRKIIKNLLILCFGFLLLFVAYNGLVVLQSTLNQKQGIGVLSQAVTYFGFCVSALLLPKYTIKKLGCKRALMISMGCYIPYIAANFYFNWLTMVPSALLVGLSASVLWSSQCTYCNESSVMYSTLCLNENFDKQLILQNSNGVKNNSEETNDKSDGINQEKFQKLDILSVEFLQNEAENKMNSTCNVTKSEKDCDKREGVKECSNNQSAPVKSTDSHLSKSQISAKIEISDHEIYSKIVSSVTARVFGLFGLIFRTSDIWGNLISYYVLSDNNILDNITENGTCNCGASFCNVETECFSHNLAEPTQQMRNVLTGASVLLAFAGLMLVFLFLDELDRDEEPVKFTFDLAMATCKFARRKEVLLLLPLSSYIGFQQAFYTGDFTKSYIACSWGVYHVGLVTICYGLAAGISSTVAGLSVKYVGRIPVLIVGAAMNAAMCIYLLIWNPVPDQPLKFFISAAIWGASVGILWSQLRAFYGVIFKKDEEAAFAGFYLWDSIGYTIAFSYSNYICTYIKIYVLLAVSTVGMIGYLKTESMYMKQIRESKPD